MTVHSLRFLGVPALALGFFAVGATMTHPASAKSVAPALRGERSSKHDIRSVERRLERMIASLQRDQRDYGGHRVNAINLMQQADQQLQAAIATDNSTPH